MRRLARRLLTLCSIVSLLVGVSAGVLWHRSQRHFDQVTWVEEQGDLPEAFVVFRGTSGPGLLLLNLTAFGKGAPLPNLVTPPGFARENRPAASVPARPRGPYFAFAQSQRSGGRSVTVCVPHWAVVLASPTLPAAQLLLWARRRRVEHRRAKTGLCASCGYDLRASPGRCPECGASSKAASENR